jgi:hypothetical protein
MAAVSKIYQDWLQPFPAHRPQIFAEVALYWRQVFLLVYYASKEPVPA